ncbi:TPA: colicin immunity protein [Burkholderia multivorans]|uniref:colicin immunity protein n=1 Tax=Burkholderia multivorans TaxID=87883 RepID=UPI0009BFFFC0|nr:colicin immunity protein [Burkholderia multivorans]MBU9225782.1 colicin immunity protein [Burkholderia multivorans]MBU9352232.1 colicin immunity protein [Burkholderia multivorans]MBU9396080.1 colicin immunity protein [Burkholderia multivorans]MBU9443153.1 colicin immunity protein [Burkholderia multivorans]MBU9607089.1 colicin immunity protein [Burkholderia multivorans]
MKFDLQRRYESADDFFALEGSVVMKLSAGAAIEICERAAEQGMVVSRVEGGIWHFPGFEARLDCIWDGADPPVDSTAANQNNLAAADFIRAESNVHDVFVVTASRMTGW